MVIRWGPLACAVVVGVLADGAVAQTNAPNEGLSVQNTSPPDIRGETSPAEIIVTARKFTESLVDVPVAITVFDDNFIERAQLESVADLALLTPGFSLREGFGRTGGPRPAIRGMSNVLGAPNAAFFVDGIFVSGNITSYQLENLERVEVIKGPQSALFGRSTFAGAVNFVTRQPTNNFEGRVKVSAAEFGEYETSAYISGPLVADQMYAEISGRYFTFGGDYRNADSGERNIGEQSSWNIGGKLLVTPTDNFEATLNLGYNRDVDGPYAYGFLGSQNLNCFPPTITGATGFPFFAPISSSRARGYFCGEIETPEEFAYNYDEIRDLGGYGLERDYFRSSLAMTLNDERGWSITSVTAFNYSESVVGQDNILRPSTTANFSINGGGVEDFSQELRVQSPPEARLRGVVGGYYYRERDRPGFTTNITTGDRLRFDTEDGVNNYALFGFVEVDATERLTLSAEARYQWETIIGSTERAGIGGGGRSQPSLVREAEFKAFLPRITARYEVTPDFSLYVSAAKGNKPGGFNDFPTDARAADLDAFRALGLETFDEEQAWSYELGIKGVALDRVLFSAAGFYVDWDRQQLTRSEPYVRLNGSPNTTPFIQNAGRSEVKGIEAELSGRATDWLFLRLGYAYIDATFAEFYDETTEEIFDTDGRASFLSSGEVNPADVDGPDGDVSGNQLPQTPAHQLTASAEVSFPLASRLEFFARGDYGYESKRFVQVDNLAHTGDSHNLTLSTGITRSAVTFTLFVENALDDDTPLVVTRLVDFTRPIFVPNPVTGGRRFTFFRDFTIAGPRRRQFGASLIYRF